MRQEKPNAAVLRQKLIEVRIIRRANEAIDLGHGSFERRFWHSGKNRCPESTIINITIKQ